MMSTKNCWKNSRALKISHCEQAKQNRPIEVVKVSNKREPFYAVICLKLLLAFKFGNFCIPESMGVGRNFSRVTNSVFVRAFQNDISKETQK